MTTTDYPPTQDQFNFLKLLISERALDPDVMRVVENCRAAAVAGTLTRGQASELITVLKTQPRKIDAGRDNGTMTPGVYRATDGTLYRVYPARADRSRLLAKIVIRTAYGVEFEYAGAASRFVNASQRLSREEAAAFGRETGWCVVCGTELTDPDSIAAGIGPVCATKF
jgi:hypothetical protein